MMNIVKLKSTLHKSVGVCLSINIFISLAAAAYITWDLTSSHNAEFTNDAAQDFLPESEEVKKLSAAEISLLTRGKAVFRTSRIRKARVVDELAYYQLIGISVRNNTQKAYMRNRKFKKMETKRIGDMIGSYEITGISKEGVRLRRGNEEVLLPKG